MVVATINALSTVAPENPVPPIPQYSQFFEIILPPSTQAIRAYRGYLRPFSDDATARRVLRTLVADLPLQVFEGRLDSDAAGLAEHPLEPFLKDMAEPCTVVILEFAGKEHPRAYLVDPLPNGRASNNHHTWWQRKLSIDGKATPQLCIYSANQFSYDPSSDLLPQFLDQVSTYLAKHLIFLRTRMLHMRRDDGTLRKVNSRKPWQPVNTNQLKYSKKLYLYGTWVGPVAPHGPAAHLLADDPDSECHCNSGELYRDCHMQSDQLLTKNNTGGTQ